MESTTTVGVVGLGYVGLPLAVEFAEAGCHVVGVDVNEPLVRAIAAGRSHIEDIPAARLAAAIDQIDVSTDPATPRAADAVIICVPTPLTPQREPDLGPLLAAAHAVGDHL